MLKLHVEVRGLIETRAKFQKIKVSLSDNNDVMEEVGKWFLMFLTDDVFATEGGVIDSPWPDLAMTTIAQKVKLGYAGRGTLVRTGTLQTGWQLFTTSSYALLKNSVPYAIYHDSDDARSKIPQRKLVKFSNKVQDEIIKRLKQAVIDKINKAMA